MKKTLVLLAFISSAYVCGAQIVENFSDNDYLTNPIWTPDNPNNWTVVNEQLRSNSVLASSSFFITTPSTKATQAQWEVFMQLQFNTSSANFVDVYLLSAEADLSSATNSGYFVRVGGTPDEISLYKITNGVTSILINGVDGITNRSNNPLRIKVIRDATNTWTLERDASGGTTYTLEGIAEDNSISTSQFFGFKIQQSTASFFNKHFFDDVYVGDIVVEKDPPVLQHIEVLSSTQLMLTFNEELESTSAQNPTNYLADNNLGNASLAELQNDLTHVLLTFTNPFANGVTQNLQVMGVADLAGNVINPVNKEFLFFQSAPVFTKDIIITEIFADPSPQVGLPEAEFIELFNRSENPIQLTGWSFSDGSSTSVLPSQIILPNQYWVICSTANVSLFSGTSNTIGVANFPTLNNSGEALLLKSNENLQIDSVYYTLEWYRDEDKQEGGWTLELIDTDNPCGEGDNWAASEDGNGGTPGKINSIKANKPDLTGPKLISAYAESATTLKLVFDEKLEKNISTVTFTLSPDIEISKASFTSAALTEIKIDLVNELSVRQIYTIHIENLRDCNGNFIQEEFDQLNVALAEAAQPGDLLLNEVLFNPRPGGIDFIEIVNISPKYINLKNWSLANYEDETAINLKIISESDFMIAPSQYLILCTDKSVIENQYPAAVGKFFLSTTLPSMSDGEGSVAIVSNLNLTHDFFTYLDDYHTPILKDKEGVSLERISFSEATQNPGNWKSASAASGFATPGYQNSNARPENSIDENTVRVEPEIFSPVMPGQDFAQIHYQFDEAGLVANVNIVDQQGRIIQQLANNETLGQQGFLRWDGDREDGTKARAGYYFVWFEVYDLTGMVKTYRKRVVIGR